jgi:hypothetical protein
MADITNIGNDNVNLTEGELLSHQEKTDAPVEPQESKNKTVFDNPESAEQETQEKETDWEQSAKYFQSEKDKLYAENQKIKNDLERFQALGEFVEGREDVKKYISDAIDGGSEPQQITPPEDFDPWEAYNDPNSESFKFRNDMEQQNISQAVENSQKKFNDANESKEKMREFDNELDKQGLNAEEKQKFYDFANTPLDKLGTDTLVKMWQAADSKVNTLQNASGRKEFEAVRRTQAEPTPVGVLQGEQPPAKNATDEVWDRIVAADNRTRII